MLQRSALAQRITCAAIQHESELYQFDAASQPEFNFNGRSYKVDYQDGKYFAVDQTDYSQYGLFATPQKFFVEVVDRIVDFSLTSREARLSARLLASHQKHFRVDVDKTLLYRCEELPAGKNPEDFEKTFLHHKKYGEVQVFVNKNMLEFLKKQQEAGAKISITSTGGWVDGTDEDAFEASCKEMGKPAYQQRAEHARPLSEYLASKGLELTTFDNKKNLNKESHISLGLFQKYRVLKNKDTEKRWNIMIDDQWHQRAHFTHSISAALLGMG